MRLVSQYITNSLNAGPKAKLDVERILAKTYNAKILTNGLENDINDFFVKLKKLYFYCNSMYTDDLVIVQFPFTDSKNVLNLSKKKVAFIHDIEGLRNQNSLKEKKDIELLKSFNYIIAHNNIMANYLVNNGIEKEKIIILEIFDYLCDLERNYEVKFNMKNVEIIYTGNLDKAPFLNQLDDQKMNFNMNVYGVLTKKLNNKKINYKGSFLPDELPNRIEGNLGLVWDGLLDESDEKKGFKNYTRYNNPHKLSCYLAADIPVIVWKKSAVADFVEKYDIGYLINNIYDINTIDFSDYYQKKKNVKKVGKKVRTGFYTKRAIDFLLTKFE